MLIASNMWISLFGKKKNKKEQKPVVCNRFPPILNSSTGWIKMFILQSNNHTDKTGTKLKVSPLTKTKPI